MRRRHQRQKGKRKEHATSSRNTLLSLLYNIQDHPLSHRRLYARHMFKVSRKHRLRFTSEVKEVVCRKCSTLLVQGSTARVRLRAGVRIQQCLECGYVRRIPYKSVKGGFR